MDMKINHESSGRQFGQKMAVPSDDDDDDGDDDVDDG